MQHQVPLFGHLKDGQERRQRLINKNSISSVKNLHISTNLKESLKKSQKKRCLFDMLIKNQYIYIVLSVVLCLLLIMRPLMILSIEVKSFPKGKGFTFFLTFL